jgi:hypothetical protein
MEENILTFREWSENFVKVVYDMDWYDAKIYSFDRVIKIIDKREKVKDLLQNQSSELLKLYRDNFDSIQKHYQSIQNQSV